MTTTITPAILKQRAPMFASVRNADVQLAIDEAVRWTNEAAWGASHFNDGILYFACHVLDENEALRVAEPGQSNSAVSPGPVMSEKILSWSTSYAVSEGGTFDDPLATTAWGRRYLARRSLVFASRCL